MAASEIDYVVDTAVSDDMDAADTLRTCLRFIADRAGRFECDLPTERAHPDDVVQAADVLHAVARHPDRRPPATGVLDVGDPLVWDAFVTFAPHSLDGSVWARDGGLLATFADESGSVVVRLDAEAAQRLAELVTPAELVAVSEWRARRRRT